jgi:8-oxo-dGTP pyrophosphatase MutT (NUDIX family)
MLARMCSLRFVAAAGACYSVWMEDDPRIGRLRRVFESRPARAMERDGVAREAAVALLVRSRSALELLLIRRAELQGDPWSGHVALPGGRRAPGDDDLLGTACREAEEEVGIDLGRTGRFIGALDEIAPSTPFLPPIVIAPFVLAVPPDTRARPDAREVQAALWVPVDALRDTSALSEVRVDLPGGGRFPSLVYRDFVIWGLTFRILRQFLEVADRA